MAKKSFFAFAAGTAAAAAGVYLTRKKGGWHITVDVDSPRLGESAAQWKEKHDAETRATAAGPEVSENEKSEI